MKTLEESSELAHEQFDVLPVLVHLLVPGGVDLMKLQLLSWVLTVEFFPEAVEASDADHEVRDIEPLCLVHGQVLEDFVHHILIRN